MLCLRKSDYKYFCSAVMLGKVKVESDVTGGRKIHTRREQRPLDGITTQYCGLTRIIYLFLDW